METFQKKKPIKAVFPKVECGKILFEEWSDSKKHTLMFTAAFVIAGLVLSVLVFPFWHLIRADVYEDVEILANDNGVCYANTLDKVPKIIENCNLEPGAKVTIKFGEGLAWATIVNPDTND